MNGEIEYLKLLREVLCYSEIREDRTGIGTRSVFGREYRHDLSIGFPLLTTKKMSLKSIAAELVWFISGSTNNNDLEKLGATIWRDWQVESGDLGPIYGKQLRDFNGVDQLSTLIKGIKERPYSRRHIISYWNPNDLPDESISPQENVLNGKACLPPCHILYQFYVSKGELSCKLTQRSGDILLGIPYNLASLALLTHIIARECGLEVGEIIHSIGDLHLYANHVDQAKEQLNRVPFPLPRLRINPDPSVGLFDLRPSDFIVVDYTSHSPIKAPIAV